MVVSMSAVVLLGVLVLAMWRYQGLRAWHAAACVLFGFYLTSTSMAPYITNLSQALAHWLAGLTL
jgi:hypothetical protein